jgi:DNA-directed RNA polymerase specialized sigma subunit
MSAGVSAGSKKFVRAHRISWEIANGPVPDGLFILHKCDNQGCVNPAHLYAGTQQQNVRDRAQRKRGKEHRQGGIANDNAKLSEDDVMAIRVLRKKGVGQTGIGRMFGVSQAQISKIENGKAWQSLRDEG